MLLDRTLYDDETPLWWEPQNHTPAWGALSSPNFVVELEGDLDIATVGQLAEALSGLEALSPGRIVVDCRDVSFCDGRGLTAFLTHRRRIEHAGGGFAIVTSPAVDIVADAAGVALPVTSPPAVFSDVVLIDRIYLGAGRGSELVA